MAVCPLCVSAAQGCVANCVSNLLLIGACHSTLMLRGSIDANLVSNSKSSSLPLLFFCTLKVGFVVGSSLSIGSDCWKVFKRELFTHEIPEVQTQPGSRLFGLWLWWFAKDFRKFNSVSVSSKSKLKCTRLNYHCISLPCFIASAF